MKRLDELFDVSYGSKLDMNKMVAATAKTGIAFIGRKGGTEELSGFVEEITGLAPYPADFLTVALGGSPLAAFVQQRPFYTAQNVAVLEPVDPKMPLRHRLYYAMCIKRNAWLYYPLGREANRTLGTIEVPDEPPEWVDDCEIPSAEGLQRSQLPPVPLGNAASWPDFRIGELFSVSKGKRVTRANRAPGVTRFIGASQNGNGITDLVDLGRASLRAASRFPTTATVSAGPSTKKSRSLHATM